MSLLDFLLDRIDEDESTARAASPGPWTVRRDDPEQVVAVDGVEVTDAFALSGPQTRATADHIARHHPVRVLAECHARRELIASVASLETPTPPEAVELGDELLRALAHSYRDHPSFDPAWAL